MSRKMDRIKWHKFICLILKTVLLADIEPK